MYAKNIACVLSALVLAGCGAAPSQVTPKPSQASASLARPESAADLEAKKVVTSDPVKVGTATIRLTANPATVRRGGKSLLTLDVQAGSRQIALYNVSWDATAGSLSRSTGLSSGANTWTAPNSFSFSAHHIRAHVHVLFADGTLSEGDVEVPVRVSLF